MNKGAPLVPVLAAATLLVVACSEDRSAAAPAAKSSPAAAPVASKPATPAAPAAPAPLTYTYNPVGKRDPFRSPVEELHASANPEANSCGEPLCQWDLDQLTLVAVVTGEANPIAMVEDPQGRGFIVRRNSKMGKQGGKVTNILRDSVIVTEFWQRPDSKERVANPVSIKLRPDTKGLPAMDLASGKMVQ